MDLKLLLIYRKSEKFSWSLAYSNFIVIESWLEFDNIEDARKDADFYINNAIRMINMKQIY